MALLEGLGGGSEVVLLGLAGLLGLLYVYKQKEAGSRAAPPVKERVDEEEEKEEEDVYHVTGKSSLVDALPTADIPGMDPSSELGNVMDIAAAGSYFDFLLALHKKYGPIAKFWHGPALMVSLASPELFRKTSKAGNRPPELFEVFSPLMTKESLAFVNGAEGRRRRGVYDHSLSFAAMENYIPGSQVVADEWVAEWRSLGSGSRVSVKDFTLRFAMKVLLQQLYGEFFTDEDLIIKMQKHFDVCWHELESRARGDIPAPDSERNLEFLHCRDEIFDVIGELIDFRRQNPPASGEERLVDVVLDYCGQDVTTAKGELVNFLIGGYMSSGDILTWLIFFLSTNLDVQDKLYAELDEYLEKDDLSFESIPHLKYMKQVIDETMRASLIGTFVARTADTDMNLGGYLVPSGTTLVQAMGVVHIDEQYYPEPRKFDPERFTEENIKKRPTHSFLPFGFAGGRKCPGSRLAYMECMIFMSSLLQNYRMEFAPGQQQPKVIHGVISFLEGQIDIVLQDRRCS